jgi:hypothetical protein
VEITEFREYLKEQILKWETWHQSQVDEIRMHESCRDHDKEQLENGIRLGTVDPEDSDDLYVLSYDWHKHEVSSIPKDLELRLIAEREPICFEEASIAAMVALFWCDINRSNRLVPDYDKQLGFDLLDPYGTFQKYLGEQWRNPILGRYKRIDWYVEAAIKAYQSRIAGGGVEEMEPDSIAIDSASPAIPEANQVLQVNPPISEVTPPHVPPISTDDSLDAFPERLAPKLPQVADTGLTKAESKEAKDQTWQDVLAELERMRLKGEAYTSQAKLATKIGCKKFLVHKALNNGSAELQEWRTKSHGESRLNVSPETSALAIERTAQSREDDPAEFIEQEQVDEVLEYLIKQAGESQRQHLVQMPPDQRQELAKTLLRDPDKEDQFLRHRKAQRSRRD